MTGKLVAARQRLFRKLYEVRRGPEERRAIAEMQAFQWLPPEAVVAKQWDLLRPLLRHAHDTVPYWREAMDKAGLVPEEATPQTYARLPSLPRIALKRDFDRLVSTNPAPGHPVAEWTSGTTRQPARFLKDSSNHPWGPAAVRMFRAWLDDKPGETTASFPRLQDGKAPFRHELIRNLKGVRSLPLELGASRDGPALAALFSRWRPENLYGYPSALRITAAALKEAGITLAHRPKRVVYHSEDIDDDTLALIREVFGAPVTSLFACREFWPLMAQTCPDHVARGGDPRENLHLNSLCLLAEVVDDEGRPVAPGSEGRLLVTDLRNRVMPFLRYEVGDRAILAAEPCPCGRGLTLIKRLVGRDAEELPLPSGRKLPLFKLNLLIAPYYDLLWQYQVHQVAPGKVIFRVVPREGRFGPAEAEAIEKAVPALMGEPLDFKVEIVSEIHPEPSGKRPILKPWRGDPPPAYTVGR